MAEKLAPQELTREVRTVERLERSLAPAAQALDGPRHQLLARPDSTRISTGTSTGAKRSISAKSARMAALRPMIPWNDSSAPAIAPSSHHLRVSRTLAQRRGRAKAKVAVARKLLVRLFIMLRDHIDYDEFRRRGRAPVVAPS